MEGESTSYRDSDSSLCSKTHIWIGKSSRNGPLDLIALFDLVDDLIDLIYLIGIINLIDSIILISYV